VEFVVADRQTMLAERRALVISVRQAKKVRVLASPAPM
jgi:hypothetical protein